MRFIGFDSKEYSRKENEYEIKEIFQPGAQGKSYWAFLKGSKNYIRNIQTESMVNSVTLVPNKYQFADRTVSTTDHYSDAAHVQETTTSFVTVEFNAATNQQRTKTQVHLQGTSYETTTSYSYDARGNAISQQLTYTGTGLDAVPSKSLAFEYDGFGNSIAITDSSDTPQRRTETSFDDVLHQFATQSRRISNTVTLIQNVAFNYQSAFGQAATTTDVNGNKQYFSYDNYGRLVQVRADADNSGFFSSGIKTLVDFQYSSNGAATTAYPLSAKTIQYSGSGANDIKTRVFKDGLGREIQTIQSALNVSGKFFTKSGKIVYDAKGRVIRQSQRDWAADDEIDVYRAHSGERNPRVIEYDASGRVLRVTSPPAFAGEAPTFVQTQFNDPWQQVVTHSIGKGKKTTKNARGHLLYVEDFGTGDDNQPLVAKMAFCYDIAGNSIKRTDLNSGSLNCVGSSGENVSSWRYDGFGRIKQKNDPDMGSTTFSYNGFGDMVNATDQQGRTTSILYDNLGRVIQKILPIGEGNVNYSYDSLAGAENALGRIVAIEDNAQRKTFSYDKLGRRKKEIRRLKDPDTLTLESPYTTNYVYDLLDRTTTIDYPIDPTSGAGVRVCYGYNSFGMVSNVKLNRDQNGADCSSNGKVIIESIAYNEFGQKDAITRGNGITSRYEYDNKRRVAALHYDKGSNEFVNANYSYNIQNSITKVEFHPTAVAAGSGFMTYHSQLDYKYDGLNRLIDAKGKTFAAESGSGHTEKTFSRAYGYSLNGNITRKDIRDYSSGSLQDRWSYSYQNHKATSIHTTAHGGIRFTMNYDATGNTISKIDQAPTQKPYQENAPAVGSLAKVMAYDSYNRITSVTNANSGAEMGRYFYDDQGFRVRKRSHQVVEGQERTIELEYHNKYFALEKQTDIIGQDIANTQHSVNNVYLDGLRIAAVLPGGNARYFLTDQVDSVHVVTNDVGEAINRTEYLPYGETWFVEGEKNYSPKFNSQELDKESDLYFFNARHYDPEIARFVTADTVVDGNNAHASWNRYMYVHGNPIMLKDPSGNFIAAFAFSMGGWGSVLSSIGGAIASVAEVVGTAAVAAGNFIGDMFSEAKMGSLTDEKGNRIGIPEASSDGLVGAASGLGATGLKAYVGFKITQAVIDNQGRSLTGLERYVLEDVFKDQLDYDSIRIVKSKLAPNAVTIGNAIILPPSFFVRGGSDFIDPSQFDTLVHEATHAYQYQSRGKSYEYAAQALNQYRHMKPSRAGWEKSSKFNPYNIDEAAAKGYSWQDLTPDQQGRALEEKFRRDNPQNGNRPKDSLKYKILEKWYKEFQKESVNVTNSRTFQDHITAKHK